MSRYIDADAFIQSMVELYKTAGWEDREVHFSLRDTEMNIDGAPTADIRENVHGEWILHDKGLHTEYCTCSKCNAIVVSDEAWNYCPNCGADMRGGAE